MTTSSTVERSNSNRRAWMGQTSNPQQHSWTGYWQCLPTLNLRRNLGFKLGQLFHTRASHEHFKFLTRVLENGDADGEHEAVTRNQLAHNPLQTTTIGNFWFDENANSFELRRVDKESAFHFFQYDWTYFPGASESSIALSTLVPSKVWASQRSTGNNRKPTLSSPMGMTKTISPHPWTSLQCAARIAPSNPGQTGISLKLYWLSLPFKRIMPHFGALFSVTCVQLFFTCKCTLHSGRSNITQLWCRWFGICGYKGFAVPVRNTAADAMFLLKTASKCFVRAVDQTIFHYWDTQSSSCAPHIGGYEIGVGVFWWIPKVGWGGTIPGNLGNSNPPFVLSMEGVEHKNYIIDWVSFRFCCFCILVLVLHSFWEGKNRSFLFQLSNQTTLPASTHFLR